MGHSLDSTSILDVFTSSIENLSGRVSDVCESGSLLMIRSLLPVVAEVALGDEMQGGVALRSNESEIAVHPYLFRQVCRNGAITAHSLESVCVSIEYQSIETVSESIREAVYACGQPEVFVCQLGSLKNTLNQPIDMALTVLPLLKSLPGNVRESVMRQFFEEGGRTRFHLMNAVTAVARDTPDPERRWRLEELGGQIGAVLLPSEPIDSQGLYLDLVDA